MNTEKKNDNIKISIIIPVYNTEKYISRCIKSIVEQELKNYEIIIIDDCSIDNSYQILEDWEGEFSQIKLFQNEKNMGAGFTKNKGLKLCTGKYICFVDSDDWIKKDCLKKLLELAEKTNCDAIYYGEDLRKEGQICNSDDIVEKLIVKKTYANGIQLFEKMLDDKKVTVSACHYFIRRGAIDKRVSFSENVICDDWIFTAFFLCSVGKIIVLENDLYVYYQRSLGNVCSKVKSISMAKERFSHALYIWRNIGNTNETINRVRTKCFVYMMISIHNDYVLKKHNAEIEYNEINYMVNKDQQIKELFEKSKYLSAYGEVFDDTIKKLKKAKRVYIYGTGNYGIDTYRVLYMNRISIDGFIETQKKKNSLLNIPIYSLKEFIKRGYEGLIIVAVSNKYKDEITALLKENNITNYYYMLGEQSAS